MKLSLRGPVFRNEGQAKDDTATQQTTTALTNALGRFAETFGVVAAQNLLGNQENDREVQGDTRPRSGTFGQWIQDNTALAIGIGLALLLGIGLLFRRK